MFYIEASVEIQHRVPDKHPRSFQASSQLLQPLRDNFHSFVQQRLFYYEFIPGDALFQGVLVAIQI